MVLHQLKSFCTEKGIISKIHRQLTDWGEDILADRSDEGLIFKIYKEPRTTQYQKINKTQIKKG